MGTWRLILAWMVIACHTKGYEDLFTIDVGTIAISTFFFISGFLMPLAYTTHYQKQGLLNGCRRFYINRLLRLYPIYWASLLCMLGLKLISYILHGTKFDAGASTYIQNFLLIGLNQSTFWGSYLRFNNPAWTLDVELQYYLLVPLLLFLASKFNIAQKVVFVCFGVASCYLYFNPVGLVDIDRSLLAWAIFFALGYTFYEGIVVKTWSGGVYLMLLIVVTLVVVASSGKEIYTFLITMGCIGLSALLLTLQKDYKFGYGDRLAGDLSYPVYIFHIVFMAFTAKIIELTPIVALETLPIFMITFLIHVVVSTSVGYVALKFISDPIDLIRARIRESNG